MMNDKTKREFKTALDRNLSREVEARYIWTQASTAVDSLLCRGVPAELLRLEFNTRVWLLLYQFGRIDRLEDAVTSQGWEYQYHGVAVRECFDAVFFFPDSSYPPDFILWQRL